MTRTPVRVVLVGAGPRGTGLLERLTAHAPAVLRGRPLELHVVDAHPFGGGWLWRLDQPPLWHLDHPGDAGILPDGPGARAWAATDQPADDRRHVTARPGEPLSRRLVGQYLTWAFWRVLRLAPAGVAIRTYRATAVDVTGDDGPQRVTLDTGTEVVGDVVLLAQGRHGSEPTTEQRARAAFADRHGLHYRRPRGGDPAGLDDVSAGVDVLLRDAGPLTADLVALITLGRGGQYVENEYRPSGAEPRIHLLPAESPLSDSSRPAAAATWATQRAALVRAGVVVTHSEAPHATRGAFTLPGVVARVLVEPDTGAGPLRTSSDPLRRALAGRGELAGWSATGALLDRTGRAHPRRFAVGPAAGGADTFGPAALAETDAAARATLTLLAGVPGTPANPRDLSRVEVRRVPLTHPDVVGMFAELTEEYSARYGDAGNLYDLPDGEFDPPNGTLLVLREDGVPIAGGAFRRYDARTAELKRIWTHTDHRRRGLARRVVAELERAAADLGYQAVYLTTGPRQPEARALYLAAGYEPRFDTTVDPETIGPLPFGKELTRQPHYSH